MYGHLLLRRVSVGSGRKGLTGQVLVKMRHSSGSLVLGLVFLWVHTQVLLCCNIIMISMVRLSYS